MVWVVVAALVLTCALPGILQSQPAPADRQDPSTQEQSASTDPCPSQKLNDHYASYFRLGLGVSVLLALGMVLLSRAVRNSKFWGKGGGHLWPAGAGLVLCLLLPFVVLRLITDYDIVPCAGRGAEPHPWHFLNFWLTFVAVYVITGLLVRWWWRPGVPIGVPK